MQWSIAVVIEDELHCYLLNSSNAVDELRKETDFYPMQIDESNKRSGK